MSTLLHIDSSATAGVSLSRTLTAEFAAAWQAAHPVSATIHRDLGLHAPAALDRVVLSAIKARPNEELGEQAREARRASNLLVEEFLSADAFVMGVPMYNFSVPASLKAWIDHVVQTGRTVVRGKQGSEPVITGRKALIIATRAGDFSKGGSRDGWDFVGPYLEKVLGYVGLETEILPVVNAAGRPGHERHLAETRERLRYVLKRWTAAEAAAASGEEAGGKEGLNHAA